MVQIDEEGWQDVKFTKTQQRAVKYLFDNKTTEILFGGSAGGGKSWLGCAWLIVMCLQYPKNASKA